MEAEIGAFGGILLFFLFGAVFVLLGTLLSRIIAPHRPNPEKLTAYECGEAPVGSASIQFNNRFYLIGLVFLIFDVEILFMFPWATVFANAELIAAAPAWGIFAAVEMLIFAGILLLGLAYVWGRGDLAWIVPRPRQPERVNPVPDDAYAAVNQRYAGATHEHSRVLSQDA